jgi:hypothetical protein
MPAGELLTRAQISRATLMRTVRALGQQVVARGRARRTAYAARRAIRGLDRSIPLFQVDAEGRGKQIANIDPIDPSGCALDYLTPFDWPLPDAMRDGWFDGLPYPLDDLRPQGFLGRNFARHHASVLQVEEDPRQWSEDDVLYALSLLGSDLPGNLILGEAAYRRFLAEVQAAPAFLDESQFEDAYIAKALDAMNFGVADSSAGGEFPKFTAKRLIDGRPTHVIVKFSGADTSPGTQRWSDLLVCEHLALCTAREQLGIDASPSAIYQAGGRTFLEVQRFDRHGIFGRSAVCSWAALNAALVGLAGKPWTAGAASLRAEGLIDVAVEQTIQRIWHFGQLIANTDMHDGNLAFRPGLTLAPVYDMLPMLYAPARGVELPDRDFAPKLPLPTETDSWLDAARAGVAFWRAAADDARISDNFRSTCAGNAETLGGLVSKLCA